MPAPVPVRVLVVDPHPLMRGALELALAAEQEVAVTAALPALDAGAPGVDADVALVDLARAHDPWPHRLPVVLMGLGEASAYARMAPTVGAAGYWSKDGDPRALVRLLVRAAAAGRAAPARSVNLVSLGPPTLRPTGRR